MMYFIPWVLLLAFVILSVPIASWLDGRKRRAEFAAFDDELDEEELGGFDDDDDEGEPAEGEPAPVEDGGAEEFGGEGDFGGDDFGGDDFAEFEEVK